MSLKHTENVSIVINEPRKCKFAIITAHQRHKSLAGCTWSVQVNNIDLSFSSLCWRRNSRVQYQNIFELLNSTPITCSLRWWIITNKVNTFWCCIVYIATHKAEDVRARVRTVKRSGSPADYISNSELAVVITFCKQKVWTTVNSAEQYFTTYCLRTLIIECEFNGSKRI